MRPLWIAVVVAEQPHGPGIGSLTQLPIGKLCEGTGPDDCSQQTKTTLTTFSSLKKTRLSQEDPSHHCRQLPRTNPTENAKITDSSKNQGQNFVHGHRTTSSLCLDFRNTKIRRKLSASY